MGKTLDMKGVGEGGRDVEIAVADAGSSRACPTSFRTLAHRYGEAERGTGELQEERSAAVSGGTGEELCDHSFRGADDRLGDGPQFQLAAKNRLGSQSGFGSRRVGKVPDQSRTENSTDRGQRPGQIFHTP
ncbi:hypothetical protein [Streptomyces sp. NPDC056069]|uniref:hypothetical protein n=1 Tax=Streptomyces sp. NPDC056069 TaxID=3345702 RepID=UPI0035E2A9F5